jgi:invasion protein IalB
MTILRFAPALALSAMLAMPVSLWAQETTTDPAAPAQPAETVVADPAADTGLQMGQDVADTGPGSTYTLAKFDDWEQRCVRSGTEADPCQLYQLLKDEAGTSVAEITIFGLPEGSEAAAGATFIAPLETLLTTGLQLQIDAAKAKAYPFSFCAQIGCVIRMGFTAAEIEAMKKGNALNAVIVPFVAQDQQVKLTVSLKGFTAGYEAVNAANVKADAAAKAAAPAPAPAPNP